MSDDRRLSDHPTDKLIRELIQTGRPVEQSEIGRIRDRKALAGFDPRIVPARARERGLTYGLRTVQQRDDALFIHVVRRVLIDGQWAFGTTQREYLDDLHRSIRAPSAQFALYHRHGGYVAATLTPTHRAIAAGMRGPRSLPELWVVYSADRGIP